MLLMLKLTRNSRFILLVFGVLLFPQFNRAQTAQEPTQIERLLTDALVYAEKYVVPATDAAVYQSSSSWIFSPKKKEKWDVTLGLHTNIFFVPNANRSFSIKNSDFQFFSIENGTSATVPTALGSDDQIYLVGTLENQQVRLKTPEGINQEVVVYPYLHGAIELPYGFEFLAKYSTKTKLKKGDYQVYGFGLKYNFSQHFPTLVAKNIHLAAAAIYSKEDINLNFLDVNTPYGNLGINNFNGLVDTYHFQISASKSFKKFEIITNLILNNSKFEYLVSGNNGANEPVLPVQSLVNNLFKIIAKDKTNFIAEVSGRYQISKFYIQSSIAFNKFVNGNIGIQYQFN